MGFLDRFFDNSKPDENSFWNVISSETQIDEIILLSEDKPQIILKHSNKCGTSFFAKKNLETIDRKHLEGVDIYSVDVIKQRELSILLGEKVEVRHQSPQLIVLFNSKVIWQGFHQHVNEENVIKALNYALG